MLLLTECTNILLILTLSFYQFQVIKNDQISVYTALDTAEREAPGHSMILLLLGCHCYVTVRHLQMYTEGLSCYNPV